ncbi:hypothetical protein Tsubulata_011957 [Turnera subulata]|uniref:Protein MIZU-KUSSEI 1 n=1 Tax=Turnera subulata TaxID=218843 RepID=A0A9Q0GI39_9ROSI|nr:hypothetical protein Tsubulata_011957 [Turnera subulata]
MGATNITSGVTAVDCQKQVRSWRLLRSLIELLIPTCHSTSIQEQQEHTLQDYHYLYHPYKPTLISSSTTKVTGTIFGFRRGKASLCIQTHSKSILLLELTVSTTILAREMLGGVLRIALESTNHGCGQEKPSSLLSTPVWSMYFNGRRVGYAVKRRPSKSDMDALRLMSSVATGAGIISGKELGRHDDELMYLRAKFETVSGSRPEAASFHLIDPNGSIDQELSIFFFRST